jgi:D-glycero-D-manno-heptose 1,7-bisphosphate phosphatase
MKAIFLDRDGTVTVGFPTYERVDSVEKVELLPKVLEALQVLAGLDYKVFLVTNQAGIAEGLISMDDFNEINQKVIDLVSPSGVQISKTYLCPHGVDAACDCRKPKPKLLLDAASEFGINLAESYMVGDRETDVMTGKNAGTKTILVETSIPPEETVADFRAKDLLEAARYIAKHS